MDSTAITRPGLAEANKGKEEIRFYYSNLLYADTDLVDVQTGSCEERKIKGLDNDGYPALMFCLKIAGYTGHMRKIRHF